MGQLSVPAEGGLLFSGVENYLEKSRKKSIDPVHQTIFNDCRASHLLNANGMNSEHMALGEKEGVKKKPCHF